MQVTKHASKEIHSGFDTQSRPLQKFKTGVSVSLQKGLMSSKNSFKKQFRCHICTDFWAKMLGEQHGTLGKYTT